MSLINHDYFPGTETYQSDADFYAVLVTSPLTSEYTFRKAGESENFPDCKVTREYYPTVTEHDLTPDWLNFTTPDAQNAYILDLENPQELEALMHYEDSIQSVVGSNLSQFAVSPDGETSFKGENSDYTLHLIFNEGTYPGSWYDMTISGTADKASIQKTENGYVLTSDNLKNISIRLRNDTDISVLHFSSDENSIVLSEPRAGILSAGEIAESLSLGDLDGNQEIDSKDAADLLTAAALFGSGLDTGLTPTQLNAADVNSDGDFNAVDAALISEYSASIGAGSFSGTFTEYISPSVTRKDSNGM